MFAPKYSTPKVLEREWKFPSRIESLPTVEPAFRTRAESELETSLEKSHDQHMQLFKRIGLVFRQGLLTSPRATISSNIYCIQNDDTWRGFTFIPLLMPSLSCSSPFLQIKFIDFSPCLLQNVLLKLRGKTLKICSSNNS